MTRTPSTIAAFVNSEICELLDLEPGELDPEGRLWAYRLTKAEASALQRSLEILLGRSLPVRLLVDHPVLAELANYLVQ